MLRSRVFLGVSSLKIYVSDSPRSYYMKYCKLHQGQQGEVNQSLRAETKKAVSVGDKM